VRAENAGGTSSWQARSFTTIPPAPSAPTVLEPTGDGAALQPVLSWAAPAGPVTRYRVEWKPVGAPWSQAQTATPSAPNHPVGSLPKGTAYDWRVRGTNAGGTGTWTRGVFTTTDRAPRRYYVKDHLGSIRAVVDPDAPGTETDKVAETRDYYSFIPLRSMNLADSMWPPDARAKHGDGPARGGGRHRA